MHAIETVQDEHRTFAAVLHGLRYLVQEIRDQRGSPALDVLGAMIYYLDTYLERIHHPRESEYVFRLLRVRCQEAASILELLETEHREGAQSIRLLEQAFMRYQYGGQSEFAGFAVAVEAYTALQYEHMRREERDILPLAKHFLLEDDWKLVDAAFSGESAPRFGTASTAKYRELFTRIVASAPPPIGVGPERR